MSTIRGVRDRRFNFVQLLNSMFEDPNLSLKAKGFIGYCLTKTDDWKFHISHLCKVLKEGEDAIYAAINECIQHGYAYRYQRFDKKGRFAKVDFIISDSKEEIETLKKEDKSTDIKCEPQREIPGTVDVLPEEEMCPHNDYQPFRGFPGPENPGTSNTKNHSHTKKEIKESKEHPKPTPKKTTPPKALVESIVPPSASAAQASIPSHGRSLREEPVDLSAPEVLEIVDMQEKLNPYFREHVVTGWIRKWGPKVVLSTIRFFFSTQKSQKQPIKKPEAWMESAFKNNFAELDHTSRENKAFAESLKKQYGLNGLKINKRYCQETATGKDYYYHLPQKVFQEALSRLISE